MKKFAVSLLLLLAVFISSGGTAMAGGNDWDVQPYFTHAYRMDKEKLYLAWEGKADLYQVYVDGKEKAAFNVSNVVLDLKDGGTHQITVKPVMYESTDADTKIEFKLGGIAGASVDLAALGVDPKDLTYGPAAQIVTVDDESGTFFDAVPKVTDAYTDSDGNVAISLDDKYSADVYKIAIRSGKDVNYVLFNTEDKEAAGLITKNNTDVTILLAPGFLEANGCFVPELDQEYGFAVSLQKWPKDYVTGAPETTAVIESKQSKYYEYMPCAIWKNAPVVTYASQTADGEITLRWDHEDTGLGCEYKIIQYDKLLKIKKGEKEVGRTSKKKYVIEDLMNGKYTYVIVPVFEGEEGKASEEETVSVENGWVAAPQLTCEDMGGGKILLKWEAAEGVENYYFKVSVGSGSLLKLVNMDYKVFDEFDVAAVPGPMEYIYILPGAGAEPDAEAVAETEAVLNAEAVPDAETELSDETAAEAATEPDEEEAASAETAFKSGVKLKFEICGIRHTGEGTEQKTAVSSQTIVIG